MNKVRSFPSAANDMVPAMAWAAKGDPWIKFFTVFRKYHVLTEDEFRLLESHHGGGYFDPGLRRQLKLLVIKLAQFKKECTWRERRLLGKYGKVRFHLRLTEDFKTAKKLSFKGSVRIESRIQASRIHVEGILDIAGTGKVIGEVDAGRVVCKGAVLGNLRARDHVEIRDGGYILGDVETSALHVSGGGQLEGRCRMSGQAGPGPLTGRR